MRSRYKLIFTLLALAATNSSLAQSDDSQSMDSAEELKLAALEALIAAPPERALPLASKVLAGNHSDEVKSRALFVLSQIDDPAAQTQLVNVAEQSSGMLQEEAIRMIGISGHPDALGKLSELYRSGDADVRNAVLEAHVIADNVAGLYDIATNAQSEDEFSDAVEMLAAMGARDELRQLRQSAGVSDSLIEAYGISGDVESLRELALDGSDPDRQAKAIEALGITGEDDIGALLAEIYRSAVSDDIRNAAVDGLMIAGDDQAILDLYRASDNTAEKRRLLEALAVTSSDLLLEVIDEALADD